MILVFPKSAVDEVLDRARRHLEQVGLATQVITTAQHVLMLVLDDTSSLPAHLFTQIEGIEKVLRVQPQSPRALHQPSGGIAFAGGAIIGGGKAPVIIAGPCSVEGKTRLLGIAREVRRAGAQLLRGGAFKPRTSPYDFCGLGKEALLYLAEARQETGMPVVSEVMSPEQIELADPYVDVYQIGARNMYNYELLREVGRSSHPVLLKRSMSATVQEFLQAAEYILLEGNLQVILCERGIRTFETHTRNTLDLAAVAALKSMTQLPVIVDPSHGTGRRELIRPMCRAAIACGADGLIIEVHDEPSLAMSDGAQAITPAVLGEIVADARTIHKALNSENAIELSSQPLAAGVSH